MERPLPDHDGLHRQARLPQRGPDPGAEKERPCDRHAFGFASTENVGPGVGGAAGRMEQEHQDALRCLGEPVTAASVPGGCYSRRVAAAAAAGGIKALFTSEPITTAHHVDGCVGFGRYTIW